MATNPANPHKYWVFRWPLSDTKVGKVGKKWPFLQNFHQKLADTQDDFPKFFSKVAKTRLRIRKWAAKYPQFEQKKRGCLSP